MGCSSFNDKYQECRFLIEELKLIIIKTFSGNYTEKEITALNQFKYEKEDEIRDFIDKLEKESVDEIQKRKIKRLKDEFYDILDEYDNSDPICYINDSSYEENENEIQIGLS